jgi:hypothetical protein
MRRESVWEPSQNRKSARGGEFELAQVNGLAQRIAMLQPEHQLARKTLDRRNFERQPEVGDARDEFAALLDQGRGAPGEVRDRAKQLRLGAPLGKHLDRCAVRVKNGLRQVNAVEPAIILPAVLKMVDHLQRGA